VKPLFRPALLLLSLLASFATSQAAHADITLGASIQQTGPVANTGRYYGDAYQFAVDRINAAGGVTVGGKKEKLVLKTYDNQSDINLSVRQYVELLSQDKVNFLLGPFDSSFVIADSAIAEKYQVPMVQGGGASNQIFSRGFKFVFGTLPAASDYFGSTLQFLSQLKPRPAKVALLYADDAFDTSVAQGTAPMIKAAALDMVMNQKYASNSADFGSIIAELKSGDVQAVLVAGHETEVLNFIRQVKSLNYDPLMYSFTVGVPSADFRHALGKDANYAYGMTPWLPAPALKDQWFGNAAEFAQAYKARFGYDPDYHAASAAADVEIYVHAIEAANSLNPQQVRDALSKTNFDSLYGPIRFAPTGQISLPQNVIQIQNDRVVAVFSDKPLALPQYPMPAWAKR